MRVLQTTSLKPAHSDARGSPYLRGRNYGVKVAKCVASRKHGRATAFVVRSASDFESTDPNRSGGIELAKQENTKRWVAAFAGAVIVAAAPALINVQATFAAPTETIAPADAAKSPGALAKETSRRSRDAIRKGGTTQAPNANKVAATAEPSASKATKQLKQSQKPKPTPAVVKKAPAVSAVKTRAVSAPKPKPASVPVGLKSTPAKPVDKSKSTTAAPTKTKSGSDQKVVKANQGVKVSNQGTTLKAKPAAKAKSQVRSSPPQQKKKAKKGIGGNLANVVGGAALVGVVGSAVLNADVTGTIMQKAKGKKAVTKEKVVMK